MNNQYPADKNQLSLYKKFPSTHYLSNPNNVLHMIAWCTFWRRNMHRFVKDYLKLNLYLYQQLTIYLMGVSNFICIIASRNDAKSFIIALYACCRCILYPGTKFRIGSSTKKQAKLIVSDKIIDELCEWSKPLKAEIKEWSTSDNNIFVKFKNGSKITVFVANENARGLRSTAICREEFRQIDKKIEDSVISPFQTVRNQPYMLDKFYGENKILQEDPVDIYISSSWVDDGHWMWDIVDQAYKGMQKHNGSILLTFDESITLSGSVYHRGGNASGWAGSWRQFLDTGNYNSYVPTKTGGGASGTWGINITGKATTAGTADVASSVAWSNVSGRPSSLPANGGNSTTVNGHTVNSNVPANAKFTDTTYAIATTSANGLMSKDMVTKLNGIASGATAVTSTTVSNWGFKKTDTWRGVQNNLTSTATDQSLSAYQGKVLKDLVDKKTTFTYSSTQPTSPASNAVWIG